MVARIEDRDPGASGLNGAWRLRNGFLPQQSVPSGSGRHRYPPASSQKEQRSERDGRGDKSGRFRDGMNANRGKDRWAKT